MVEAISSSSRRPTVRFSEEHLTVEPSEGQFLENSRKLSVEDAKQQKPSACSNRLFLAILLTVIVLVLGAVAITLILALTGKESSDAPTQQIVIFGGDGNCLDMANNCAENIALCADDFYKGMMAIYCRKSCGLCTPSIPADRLCMDKAGFASRCFHWKRNGFCANPFFDDAIRREYCAKTCGFCK